MRVVILALVLGLVGCGESAGARENIPLDQVPENVMKVAKDNLPDITFDKAWRKKNGEYEVSGKDKKGKVREIDIKPDGTVTEIE